ncbi:hypothetical protein BT69DRAFT_1333387 [Atractiella rhizophila]|nr:hypothetical protein BT69DRAFT_1333387 [Atractiella rhizophila]
MEESGKRVWEFDCSKFCNGQWAKLAKSSYDHYASYREADQVMVRMEYETGIDIHSEEETGANMEEQETLGNNQAELVIKAMLAPLTMLTILPLLAFLLLQPLPMTPFKQYWMNLSSLNIGDWYEIENNEEDDEDKDEEDEELDEGPGDEENENCCGEMEELDELAANLLAVDEQLHHISIQQATLCESDVRAHQVSEDEKHEYTPLTYEQIISLELFLICHGYAAGDLYDDLRSWLQERCETSTLSLDRIKRCITEKSHIVPEAFDMCPNTCIAYTQE